MSWAGSIVRCLAFPTCITPASGATTQRVSSARFRHHECSRGIIYLFSELFIETLEIVPGGDGQNPYESVGWHVFQAAAPGPVGSLACAIAYMLLCRLLGYALKRANLVIRM